MAVYLDASALVKLLWLETESEALRTWLAERTDSLLSSDLVRTELLRTAGRMDPTRMPRARELLDGLHLEPVTSGLTEAAGVLLPGHPVRSLDALHVASAMATGDDLEAFVTYDGRQADAARRLGLRVVSPGRDEPA